MQSPPPNILRGQNLVLGIGLALLLALPACRSRPSKVADTREESETQAIRFLSREVPAWHKENGCFSCHNNGDGARALYVASARLELPPEVLRNSTDWLAHPERWDSNRGDPGFSDKILARIQFAYGLAAAIEARIVPSPAPLEVAARQIVADQQPGGYWPIGPEQTLGSPATYGTMLATVIASDVLRRVSLPEAAMARERAEAWLRSSKPQNLPEHAALLLFTPARIDAAWLQKRAKSIEVLRRDQLSDGGWGPYPDSTPEIFDTALALLALNTSRQEPGMESVIQTGRRYLIDTQDEDGGWPGTTRPSKGDSYAQRISTSAWATLALLATQRNG